MTTFTLSQSTQDAINFALSNGPSTNNANYLAAYTAIYNDLVANGNINAATLYWFSQAGAVNSQQFTPTATGTYIWNYTIAAAASEGATITIPELQAASNDIASTVFKQLQDANFAFNDTGTGPNEFSIQNIIKIDAGKGVSDLQADAPSAHLDSAIWGGTLFARTSLQDATYFPDHHLTLGAFAPDSNAIIAGAWAAFRATVSAFPQAIVDNLLNVDLRAIAAAALPTDQYLALPSLSNLHWTFGSATAPTGFSNQAGTGNIQIYDAATGDALTLIGGSTNLGGTAIIYNRDAGLQVIQYANSGDVASTTYAYDTSGHLTQTTENFTDGHSVTLGGQDVANLSVNPTSGAVSAELTTPNGVQLAALSMNGVTDTGTFTLADNTVIDLNAIPAHASVIDPPDTPENILLGYLADLGTPMTAAQLDQQHLATLYPPVQNTYTLQPTIVKTSDTTADVIFNGNNPYEPTNIGGIAPGAIITGQGTAPITDYTQDGFDASGQPIEVPYTYEAQATNILFAAGDISRDTITNIQELYVGRNVTLTADQFASFSTITGDGNTITAASGGVFDLRNTDAGFETAIATDWSGTTLIGADGGSNSLVASLFGNDILIAGNGFHDQLIAGDGVDALIGGTGGDTFVVGNGALIPGDTDGVQPSVVYAGNPAAGSVIEGNGSGNVLEASGDITGITISGVQMLEIVGQVALTATQLSSFSTIQGGTIDAATGGTYSLQGINGAHGNLVATSDDGTTLIASNSGNESLLASNSGNDTLIAGTGTGYDLDASGTLGNNTLDASNSIAAVLDASNSSGDNRLIAGTGGGSYLNASGSFGDNTLDASRSTSGDTLDVSNSDGNNILTASLSGGDTLIAAGSFGNNTLDASHSINGDTLDVSSSHGDNILTAGSGARYYLNASGSFGSNVLNAANAGGSDTLDASNSSGDNILISGSGTSEFLKAIGSSGNNLLDASHSAGSDTLDVTSSTGNNTLIAGSGAFDYLNASGSSGNNTLDASHSAGLVVLDVTNSTGNNTLIAGSADGDDLNASGSTGNNTFVAGAGNQTIIGGEGNNTYVASAASTATTFIYNTDTGTNNSVLQFTAGISPSQVTLIHSGEDLMVSVGTETIWVPSYFAGTGNDINAIQFADGTVWDQNYIANNASIFTNGVVLLSASQFNLLNSIPGSGTIYATTAGAYDLFGKSTSAVNLTAEATGGTTLIGNDADGEILTASATGNDTLISGNGNNDLLSASNSTGNVFFAAGSGSDTMVGGAGNNTYFVIGAGSDVIINDDTGTNQSAIRFESGISPSQVALSQSGDDLLLSVGTETITVQNYFGSAISKINSVTFADGTVWDQGAIVSQIPIVVNGAAVLTAGEFSALNIIEGTGTILTATAGTYDLVGKSTSLMNLAAEATGGTTLIGNDANGETLTASVSGNDTLMIGNGNNDVLNGQNTSGNLALIGGNGNNDVLFVRGSSGDDTITAGNGIGDTLGARLSTGNVIMIGGDGGDTFNAGNGTDIMTGGAGNDIFNVGPGNAKMTGGNGNNIYNFATASQTGTYVINDFHTDGGQSVIDLAPGITSSQVAVSESGNDLVLTIGSEAITIQNYLSGSNYQIAGINFANGTSWSSSDIQNHLVLDLTSLGTATLTASQFNNYSSIQGNGAIDVSTGGTFDLQGKTTNTVNLSALSNDVTALIGNDANGETLTASATGHDSLQAGNGVGDILDARMNAATVSMTGGAGGDTFLVGAGNATMFGHGVDVFDFSHASSSSTYVVNASNSEIDLNTNVTNTGIHGDNNVINGSAVATIDISGSGDTVNLSNSKIYLNADATNVTVTGNNDVIHIRGGETVTETGTGDTVITDTVLNESNGGTIDHYDGVSQLIDLTGTAFDPTMRATVALNADGISGTVSVMDQGTTVATLNLTNIDDIGSFTVRDVGSGDVLLVDPPLGPAALQHGDSFTFNFADAARGMTARNSAGQSSTIAPAVKVNGDSFHFSEAAFQSAAQSMTSDAGNSRDFDHTPQDHAIALLVQHMAQFGVEPGAEMFGHGNGSIPNDPLHPLSSNPIVAHHHDLI